MPRQRRLLAAALALVLPVAAGCGGGGGGDRPQLTVSAAASLTDALSDCSRGFPGATVRLSFAGSDELAAQIRQGVRPDVFASADTALPERLHAEHRVGAPVVFATNDLVLAVPAHGAKATSLDALARPGVTIAIGSASVPVGAYTREVLGRLGSARSRAILANVRSSEPDVKGVVGKLVQGAADAGFVYRTDVEAADGKLRAIPLPAGLGPRVAYGAAVVDGGAHPAIARRYVEGLRHGRCARALRRAGFGPPPA